MPKSEKEKTIRNIDLHENTMKELDKIIALATKKGTGTKDEIMEMFYETFEADDNQGKSLRNTGIESKSAQKWAAMFVNSMLGKKSVKPVYDVFINVASVRHGDYEDKATNKKQPIIIATGGLILVNKKTNKETIEKLGEIVAYASDTEKIDTIEEGNVYKLEAATSNIEPKFLHLVVDDRCGNASIEKRKMTSIEKLQTNLYDITPIKDKVEDASKSKYDYRLVEGVIESISFPKNDNFARVSLSDLSLTQKEFEDKKYDAYLQALVNKESFSGIGKDSVIRLLGQIDHSNSEEWGEQTTMLFPVMIYPLLLVKAEVYESSTQESDDDVEDSTDYFKDGKPKKETKKVKPEPEEKDSEEYFENEKESEPEKVPEEIKEKEPVDKYESVKDHDCVTGGDFGKPEDIPECHECEKTEPDVYKLCHEKSKE